MGIKMKKEILVLIIVFFTITVKAQQDAQYTQYMYNMSILNPAYAGSYNAFTLNFLGRWQQAGTGGASRTFSMAMSAPVGKNVGLGLSVVTDEIGPVAEQNVFGDFSYTLRLSEKSNLALGLKAGFTFLNICLPCLNIVNENDEAFTNQNINKVEPNFGLGTFYYTDKFYVGLSIPNFLQTLHFLEKENQERSAAEIKHFFLSSGYVFDLSKDIKLKPSFMVKASEGAPISVDFSGNILFYDQFEFGVSYRLNQSISALINVRASKSLRVGYAYDYTLTNLSNFKSGAHEVFVLFNFDFEKLKIRSPRFF
jgi:type IX secretion system PorP/SprF family membrane protein